MINYLFNIVGLVYIIGVRGFIPIFPRKSPVWLAHLLAIRSYLRVDRIMIDNVDYLKYQALINGIWAPIDTLYT